jgi:hypothetical protein
MTSYEKEQFWEGLGRLYTASVNLVASTEELRKTAETHERRLDNLEVVQQWLAEKERAREKDQE